VRLFDGEKVRFFCSCSRERCYNALLSLGEQELEKLLAEEPEVIMDCEFCNQQYEFTRGDFVAELGERPESDALH
jgi:molecular chaperone Hsp33